MTLENWSDLAGLIGSLALVVTAWRNDGLYGFIERLRKAVTESTSTTAPKPSATTPTAPPAAPLAAPAPVAATPSVDPLALPVLAALQSELTTWSSIDRWSLRIGAALLMVSYLLRLAFQHAHG